MRRVAYSRSCRFAHAPTPDKSSATAWSYPIRFRRQTMTTPALTTPRFHCGARRSGSASSKTGFANCARRASRWQKRARASASAASLASTVSPVLRCNAISRKRDRRQHAGQPRGRRRDFRSAHCAARGLMPRTPAREGRIHRRGVWAKHVPNGATRWLPIRPLCAPV